MKLVFKDFLPGVDLPVVEVIEYRYNYLGVDLDPTALTPADRAKFSLLLGGLLPMWAGRDEFEVRP